MSEGIQHRRRRFQFSLRALFVLAVLAGLISLATLQRIQNNRQELEAAQLRARIAQLLVQNTALEKQLDGTRRYLDEIVSDNRRLKAESKQGRLDENPGRLPHFQRETRGR
jgi:type II secretory pathway pseudopilin PulG